jgi:hypothetical protein
MGRSGCEDGENRSSVRSGLTREGAELNPPYVLAALICRKPVDNPDGSIGLFSVCGKVTRKEVKRGVIPLGPMPESLYLFIAIAFEENKEHFLGYRILEPDLTEIVSLPEYGTVSGRTCTAAFDISQLRISKGGKYWFEILGDYQPLTRVPLRVKIVWDD